MNGTDNLSSVTPEELSRAIVETVDAGARIINLSLGVIPADTRIVQGLDDACDYAAHRGVILVAAAGNQGRIGFLPLLRHPWVIPVASCDSAGRPTPESNLSPTIGKRGLLAPGVDVMTVAPNGGYLPVSGTSAAAAIVTGSMALLWSKSPGMSALELRTAVLQSAGQLRHSVVPPLLNIEAAATKLLQVSRKENAMSEETPKTEMGRSSDALEPMLTATKNPVRDATLRRPVARSAPLRGRVISQNSPCPTCASGETMQNSGPASSVFAIGQVRMRFPTPSIEKEFAQVIASDGGQTARLTDQTVLHNTIRDNRYLANEVCWVLVIDSVETYMLVPRDHTVLDQLIEAVQPSERGLDTDVVIGTRGPMAPPEMCNGLVVPIVLVDRIYSFQKPELMQALTTASRSRESDSRESDSRPRASEMTDDEFRQSADELFERIQQLADNVGAEDEHRAVNYLAVRYPQIYTHTAEMNARDFSLTRVEVLPSRLSGTRKLVNVIFSYTNRRTDVQEKYRVRVDVTEKFPFLERGLSPYFERE